MKAILTALLISAAIPLAPAAAQTAGQVTQPITGTRLDISATGEVSRVPDIAIISAGVVTRQPTATAAIQQNATQNSPLARSLTSCDVLKYR